jgi:hypothetical protein
MTKEQRKLLTWHSNKLIRVRSLLGSIDAIIFHAETAGSYNAWVEAGKRLHAIRPKIKNFMKDTKRRP